jgi:hypothetical protein
VEVNFLLLDLILDIIALSSVDHNISFVDSLFYKDESRDQQSSCEGKAHPEEQSPRVSCIEHITSVQGAGSTKTQRYGVEPNSARSFVNKKLAVSKL